MSVSKLKTTVGVLVAVCLIGIGTAAVVGQPPEAPKVPAPAPKNAAPVPKQANAKETAAKAMQERLQGTWKVVANHNGGVKTEPESFILTIKGNTWETKEGERVIHTGTFKLVDLDASPKQVDWVIDYSVAEGDKGKTLYGIFMLDGDSLILANTLGEDPRQQRPVTFFTQSGDGCAAVMYKRADPKKDR